jgi:Zn-dependent peptidase ImmA (M78 family)/transcriptional regulator with XRE-family HTH domain
MATKTKAFINSALITWARETAGFSIPEASTRLGVTEAQLSSWEAIDQDDAPSIPQLRKLANLFKRPLAVFYLEVSPPRFEVMRDLRRLPGSGTRKLGSALQLEIRAAAERRELALELASGIDEEISNFKFTAAVSENPEAVGARIRTVLGVTDELQAKWKDANGRTGFNAWRTRIEETGTLVFQTTLFETEEASGFAIAADTLPVIAVNRKDALTRRTFSLLHEFAHLMVRISGVSDLETDEKRPPEDQRIEVFCNQVAAAALMPKDIFLARPPVVAQGENSESWSDAEIRDLAACFNVSREALLRRLLTFKRTTDKFYRQKRGQYAAEYLAIRARQKEQSKTKELKRNMPQETISNFGRPLVRMVLGNYYQERITLSEVSGYLSLKVKHIPKLEQVAGIR